LTDVAAHADATPIPIARAASGAAKTRIAAAAPSAATTAPSAAARAPVLRADGSDEAVESKRDPDERPDEQAPRRRTATSVHRPADPDAEQGEGRELPTDAHGQRPRAPPLFLYLLEIERHEPTTGHCMNCPDDLSIFRKMGYPQADERERSAA